MKDIMEGIKSPLPKMTCATCDHHSGGTRPTCKLPLPWWAEPYDRPAVFPVEGSDCPQHSSRNQQPLYPELREVTWRRET